MMAAIAGELVLLAAAAFAGLAWTAWYRRNRLMRGPARPPAGFVRTEEVFADPTTGIRQRVWYHPGTGERFYEREPSADNPSGLDDKDQRSPGPPKGSD